MNLAGFVCKKSSVINLKHLENIKQVFYFYNTPWGYEVVVLFLGACITIDMNSKINNVKLIITNRNLLKEGSLVEWDTVLVSGVWYTYQEVTQLVFKLRMAINAEKPVYIGDPSGTIKRFAHDGEMKTVAEYELSEYTYKLIGFRETEVLKLRHFIPKEEAEIEKYKYLLNDLNMSLFT